MSVHIGSKSITEIGKIAIGSKNIREVYVGDTKVWPQGELVIPCGTANSYDGNEAYPSIKETQLGSGSGTVTLTYNSQGYPDRYLVRYRGNVVIDTGYTGNTDYDYGKSGRSQFTNSLTGKKDPVTGNIYPDTSTYPDDGCPRIVGPGQGTASFSKTSTNTQATVGVYAPMSGTAWNYTLGCPVQQNQ